MQVAGEAIGGGDVIGPTNWPAPLEIAVKGRMCSPLTDAHPPAGADAFQRGDAGKRGEIGGPLALHHGIDPRRHSVGRAYEP